MEKTIGTQQLIRRRIILFAAILLSFIPTLVYAQDKTQAYYAQHEKEILPDAQTAFRKGNYQRAVLLCQWHYVIVGDKAADSLQEKAKNCQAVLEDMNQLLSEGRKENALEKALALLALNPEDVKAKELLLEEESVISELLEEEIVITQESIITEEEPAYTIEPISVPKPKPEPVPATTGDIISINPRTRDKGKEQKSQKTIRSKFGVKAGISILDYSNISKSLAYGGAFGCYDIGGSRFGGEFGAFYSPDLVDSATIFGLDGSLVVRTTDKLYPKAMLGYFSCKSISGTSPATIGMTIGVGISFLIDEHLFVDIGGKIYPTVHVHSIEKSTIEGVDTEFTTVSVAISSGVFPFINIGFLF